MRDMKDVRSFDFAMKQKEINSLNENYRTSREAAKKIEHEPTSKEKREINVASFMAGSQLGSAVQEFQKALDQEMIRVAELCEKLNNTKGIRSLVFKPKETREELIRELSSTLTNLSKNLEWAINSKLFGIDLNNFPAILINNPAVQKAKKAIQLEASSRAATPDSGNSPILKIDAAFTDVEKLASPAPKVTRSQAAAEPRKPGVSP